MQPALNGIVWLLAFVLAAKCGTVQAVALTFSHKKILGCAKAPACLEPSGECLPSSAIVQSERLECARYSQFCGRSVYKLPTTGLKITLPPMPLDDLSALYAKAYGGQAPLGGPEDPRPTQQAEMILKQSSLQKKTGLSIVEMGCAAGFLLYNVRQLASNGGKLTCFEPDADYADDLKATLTNASSSTKGLSTEHRREFFTGTELEPESVDVFMSSHAVEHLVDPCPWLSALKKVLKPGALVFTEVPIEYNNPDKNWTNGLFHMMWICDSAWGSMMRQAGFEEVELKTVHHQWGLAVRSIFRKPSH